MKKLISTILSAVLLLLLMTGPAGAEGESVSLSAPQRCTVGDTITVSVQTGQEIRGVSASGMGNLFTGISYHIFDAATPYISLTAAKAGSTTLTVSITLGDGSTVQRTASISVSCAQHTWGAWQQGDGNGHVRTCTVCGESEQAAHSFGAWTEIRKATCSAEGTETRTCSDCGYSETRQTARLQHTCDSWTVTTEPTCTVPGVETGKCTVCGQQVTQEIPVTDHQFGDWEVTEEAACMEGGEETRTCSVCGFEETQETEPAGHDYVVSEVVVEATIYSTGDAKMVCSRCGEEVEEVTPCSVTDARTQLYFETDEGVFDQGTILLVMALKVSDVAYEKIQNALNDITGEFQAYEITAKNNGTEVEPSGSVRVTIPIPDGYGTDVGLYYINEDGNAEKIPLTLSEDGTTATAELLHFSNYALCHLNGTKGTADDSQSDSIAVTNGSGGSHSSLLKAAFLILGVALIIGVTIVCIRLSDRKNYHYRDREE